LNSRTSKVAGISLHRANGAVAVLSLVVTAGAATADQAFPDAAASDPVTMGWMVGSPPAPEKTIRFDDGSFVRFPQLRWSFSHWRELFPTVAVPRGTGAVSQLPRAERSDLDTVTFVPLGATQPMTWAQSLAANYTDGIVVLHKGRVVYERYFGALKPDGQHIAHSVTKSFVGTVAATLVAEGKLAPEARITQYIPELANSAFGDATVRQVLDMTTGLRYGEIYADPSSDVWNFARAASLVPRPPGYNGPATSYDYLKSMRKEGEHGQGFAYKSPNTEVLGWLIRRVTGQPLGQVLSERLWKPLGMESDGYMQVDGSGAPLAAGGLNLQLRDLARFCEMMRQGGRFDGRQVVPAAVVADIERGGSRDDFAKGGYGLLTGWSYRNQWWVTHNDHGAYMARGVYGQACYVDPRAEMVIARFASYPLGANANLDPTSLPAYHALAAHLLAKPD
jgi:CubicO group peptidase (beta-lactamase class C family)